MRVPLLPQAMAIVEKYKNNPKVLETGRLLPVYANQILNNYLKEIADFCEIEKPLSFHIVRHTFATTETLTNGVPIETVSKLLGHRYIMKSCRDVSFEFIQEGYSVILKYCKQAFNQDKPKMYCFDDLGTENNLKYYGNECNLMTEILLSRYDMFVPQQMITHITTNLNSSEIESLYGTRVRSRMREIFNLVSFEKEARDKRV